MLKNSIKAVLFDHDDTLVGTIEPKWAHHRHVAKTFYNKDLSDEELRLHWGKPLPLMMQLLYETDQVDTAALHNIETRNAYPKLLFNGTIDTLSALKKAGLKIGLVTATTYSSLTHDFETLGISKELFNYIQTEGDTAHHKPDARVFEPAMKWLETLQIQPCEVLYVGDHLNDMKAAQGAGFHFIGVGTGLFRIEEFEKHDAKALQHLPHLLNLL